MGGRTDAAHRRRAFCRHSGWPPALRAGTARAVALPDDASERTRAAPRHFCARISLAGRPDTRRATGARAFRPHAAFLLPRLFERQQRALLRPPRVERDVV